RLPRPPRSTRFPYTTLFRSKFKTMDSERLIKWLTWIFVSAVVIVTLVFSFYFMNFKGGLSVEQDKWGVFGDFIGGTLNPILSFRSEEHTSELQSRENLVCRL